MKTTAALAATALEALWPRRDRGGTLAAPAEARSEPPEGGDPTALEPSIYRFIIRHSLRQQIIVLVLTFASFPFFYYSLKLPKIITNEALGKHHFPQRHFGFDLDQVTYLLLLCVAFLILVLINGAFKYYINTYKGRLGERMLRRFRYQLYQRMLLFPLSNFHKS